MIEIAPNFKVEQFELNVYESTTCNTNTNDMVIARFFADTEADKNKMLEDASAKYKGLKYKLTDYAKKTRKSKIGIF